MPNRGGWTRRSFLFCVNKSKKNLGTRRCRRTVLVLHTAMGNFVRVPSVGQNSEESDVFFCHVISHTKSPIKLEKPPSSPCCKDYVRGDHLILGGDNPTRQSNKIKYQFDRHALPKEADGLFLISAGVARSLHVAKQLPRTYLCLTD